MTLNRTFKPVRLSRWIHGVGLLANLGGLFRLLAGLACALGGGGKWALER